MTENPMPVLKFAQEYFGQSLSPSTSNLMSIKSQRYASFATTSRLVACLVSEGLRPAYFIAPLSPTVSNPPTGASQLVGFAILLRRTYERLDPSALGSNGLVVIAPLRAQPILHPTDCFQFTNSSRRFPRIEIVDPWEMIGPDIFTLALSNNSINLQEPPHFGNPRTVEPQTEYLRQNLKAIVSDASGADSNTIQLKPGLDAVQLWSSFVAEDQVPPKLAEELKHEIQLSLDFQKHAYDHPKGLPTLESSTIQWEQSLFEGHPTHPMHKTRKTFPPMPVLSPDTVRLERPRIRLVQFPRDTIRIRGNFEEVTRALIEYMLGDKPDPTPFYLPIHEVQLETLLEKFPIARLVDEVNPVRAHSLISVRTVAVPDLLPGISLKLCLGMKLTGAMRTVSPFTAYFGPGFAENIVPHLCYDKDILTIENEIASAVAYHEDPHVAKHASCIVRKAEEYSPERGHDLIVPCASLVERTQKPDTDTTLVVHAFDLVTEAARQKFLTRYIDLLIRAFLPPAIKNGLAFEAHGQNILARFDRTQVSSKVFSSETLEVLESTGKH